MDKFNKSHKFILSDKDKFYNWIYPTLEDVIMTETYHSNKEYSDFILSQGQKYVKEFLVKSPYRALLLFHGLGTGKTCSALITTEELIKEKHVLLFIPASLKQNWLNELTYCGNPLYTEKKLIYKNYTFINYNSSDIKKVYTQKGIINNFYLGSIIKYTVKDINKIGKIIEIKEGIFNEKKYEVNDIVVQILEDIDKQINIDKGEIFTEELNIYNNSVELYENINPFDNKIIIFDEFHNFIVTISNILKKLTKLTSIQQTKINVYNHLKTAINCKIILLSGTPIVNNSYEISYISNILNGATTIYKFEYMITSNKILSQIEKIKSIIIEKINFINYINIDFINNYLYIYITFNPNYFYNRDEYYLEKNITYYDTINKKISTFKKQVEIILKEFNLNPIFIKLKNTELSNNYMPENSADFITKFLESEYDMEYNISYFKSIKNLNVIKTLLAGKISYIKGEIPTKSIKYDIHIEFGQEQENKYIFVRNQEIQSSKKSSKNTDDINLSSLRSKSRQICNIYIPLNEIMLDENLYDSEEDDDLSDDENTKSISITKKNELELKINKFIKFYFDITNDDITTEISDLNIELENMKLINNIEKILLLENKKNNIIINIILNKIKKYSTKFSFLIDKLIKSKNNDYIDKDKIYPTGKVLIYSDFRDIKSGGVNFIGKLLEIPYFNFISFNNLFLLSKDFEKIFSSDDEKEQYKITFFNNILKNKIIEEYIKILDLNPQYKNNVFYLWQTSNVRSARDNYIAHIIYNCDENKYGQLLRIIFITKSGSEGISFKAVRQIHIIEPYWQLTRNKQVVGRGIRYQSHNQLEQSKHNVFVYNYLSTFSNNTGMINLPSDNNLTTDQYITAVSYKKQSIIDNFYDILKSVSLDCPYNNEQLECYSFNNIFYNNDIKTQPIFLNNSINTLNLEKKHLPAYLINIYHHKYILHNFILYDYEKYYLHNILIKIGYIDKNTDLLNLHITRNYFNNFTCYIPQLLETDFKLNNLTNNVFGDITNKFTRVSNLLLGGIGNNIETYSINDTLEDDEEEDEEDDEENEEDSENDFSDEDDEEEDNEKKVDYNKKFKTTSLKHINKLKDSILNNIENKSITYFNNISFNINENDYTYNINDYIFLYDSFMNEKILAGKITQITNLYITVNDIRIPLIKYKGAIIILYKIKLKNMFLKELSNDILTLYLYSDLLLNIYNKYYKNDILDKIITIIHYKIKSNYKINAKLFLIEEEQKSTQNINKDLLENIIQTISSDTINSDLIDEPISTEFISEFPTNIFNINSSEYDEILQLYINIINNYYALYKEFLEQSFKKPYFSNNTLNIISKNIILNLKNNSANSILLEQNKNLYLEIIKYYFLFETSLNIEIDESEFKLKTDKTFKGIIKSFIMKNFIDDIYKETIPELKKEFRDQYIKKIIIILDENSNNDFISHLTTIKTNNFMYESEFNLVKYLFLLKETINTSNYNIYDVEKLLLSDESPIHNIFETNQINLLEYINNTPDLINIKIPKKKTKKTKTTDSESTTKKSKKSKKNKESKESKESKKNKESKESEESNKFKDYQEDYINEDLEQSEDLSEQPSPARPITIYDDEQPLKEFSENKPLVINPPLFDEEEKKTILESDS